MTRWDWMTRNWLGGGAVLAAALIVMIPVASGRLPYAETLVMVNLLAYCLHQAEEHIGDRFRSFVNRMLAGGAEALTAPATMVINVGGVWMVNAVALLGAAFVTPGFALLAGYLSAINGVIHVIMAVVLRRSNPGLWSGIVLLIPIGVWTAMAVPASALAHVLAIAAIVVLHVAIVVHTRGHAKAIGAVH